MIIGLIDFDLITTKELCYYNFGVLLVSSYYLAQGSKVRLIINLSHENLMKYDKIYIFKDYKTNIKPINLIKDYYSLPVEEYGEGFDDKPLLPNLPDLIYTQIKTDIYKPIIYYIKNGGNKFTLSKSWNEKYVPTKLFFTLEDELLLREEPKNKWLLIYDEPSLFFTTPLGRQKMTEMLKKSIIKFVKPLRIGIIEPSYWKELFNTRRLVTFKDNLYANEKDPYLEEFLRWSLTEECKSNLKITIKTPEGIKWFKTKGGREYGDYGKYKSKRDDKERTRNTSSKEDIPIRYKRITTKRSSKSYRSDRERISEKKRRKYLPSEYARRDLERRRERNRRRGI